MAENGHLADAAPNKAVLTYDGKYRNNGYDEIKGNAGRKTVYDKVRHIQSVLQTRGTQAIPSTVVPGSEAHARRYCFDYEVTASGEVRKNFLLAYKPYANQAHHLVPVSVFDEEKKFLTYDQLVVMRKVDYNVNNGKNIMFLPVTKRSAELHNLPVHSGHHPKYTNSVKEDAKGLKESLQKAVKTDQPHETWNPPADIVKKLIRLQNKYWNLLKNVAPQ